MRKITKKSKNWKVPVDLECYNISHVPEIGQIGEQLILWTFVALLCVFFPVDSSFCSFYTLDGGATAALIGAGLSAAGSAASAAISAGAKWGSSTYMRVAKEMANYNNTIALRNWERENAYNSPAAQMERFRAAGLNPNLIYGQMSNAGSIQSGQASTNPSDYEGSHSKENALAGAIGALGNYMSMYQDLRYKGGMASNAEATAAAQLSKKALDDARAEGQKIKNAFDQVANSYSLEKLNYQTAQEQLKLENSTRYDAAILEQKLLEQKERVKNSGLTGKKLQKEMDEIDERIKEIKEQVRASQVRTKIAEMSLAIQAGQASVQNAFTRAQTYGVKQENWLRGEKNREWREGSEQRKLARSYDVFRKTGAFDSYARTLPWDQKGMFILNNLLDRIPLSNPISAFSAGNK